MKFKYYFCLLLISSLNVMSQTRGSGEFLVKRVEFSKAHVDDLNKGEVVDGSPYINEVYFPVKIAGYDGLTPAMRYHAERDEMEFLKEGKKYYVIKFDSLAIDFYGKTYKYLKFKEKDEEKSGYLVELVNAEKGKVSLFKKEKVVLYPKTEAKSGYDEAKPANYRREADKFFISLSGEIRDLPKKKKELLALFPDKEKELESFMKANKISMDDENDLINLVKFINTLK